MSIIDDLEPPKKNAMDKFLMLIKNTPVEEITDKMAQIMKIFGKDLAENMAAGVSLKVAKQLSGMDEEMKNSLNDVAKEIAKASGGGGVQLDISKLTEEQKKVLLEKPPPIRKLEDLKTDKMGNLVDDTGKVIVSSEQRAALVRDKDGNMVDKTTGEVQFDKHGALVADKKEAAKILAKKETLKQQIVTQQLKEHIQAGGKVEGMIVDEQGNLKQVAADGTIRDYVSSNIAAVNHENLVEDKDGNMVDKITGKTVIDKSGNFVAEKPANKKKKRGGKKGGDGGDDDDSSEEGDSPRTGVSGGRMKKKKKSKKVKGTRKLANGEIEEYEYYEEASDDSDGYENAEKNMNKLLKSQKAKHLRSEGQLNSSGDGRNQNYSQMLKNLPASIHAQLEGLDQKARDAKLREYYRDQLGNMPEQLDDDGDPENMMKKIGDMYNPLMAGNTDNPEFYRNLYKAFKMTRLAQAENLSARHIRPDGIFSPNFESEEFQAFRNQIKLFAERHGKCGPMCKHLMRFYQKQGFFPMKKYEGRKSLILPKLNMNNEFQRRRVTGESESELPPLHGGDKKGQIYH